MDRQDLGGVPYQHRRHFDEDKLRELAASIQREGLIETIEAIVEIVDAELMEDKQYASMGKAPIDRLKTLLDKFRAPDPA